MLLQVQERPLLAVLVQRVLVGVVGVLVWLEGPEDEEEVGV